MLLALTQGIELEMTDYQTKRHSYQLKHQFYFFLSWAYFVEFSACFIQFCTRVQGDIRTRLYVSCEVHNLPVPAHILSNDSHNTGDFKL